MLLQFRLHTDQHPGAKPSTSALRISAAVEYYYGTTGAVHIPQRSSRVHHRERSGIWTLRRPEPRVGCRGPDRSYAQLFQTTAPLFVCAGSVRATLVVLSLGLPLVPRKRAN